MDKVAFEITFSESVYPCDEVFQKSFRFCTDPACENVLLEVPWEPCVFNTDQGPCVSAGSGTR